MRQLVEFPVEGGGTLVAEVEVDSRGPTRGLGRAGELTVTASETVQDALTRVQPAAASLIARLRDLVDPPDEVELEFGIKLSAEFGAIVAKAAGDANFTVRLRWNGTG
jgi:Trypsin-co-occurring domain 1